MLELAAALGGELVVLGAAVGFGHGPFGGDPAALLHAVEGGIERAFFHAKHLAGGVLDVEDDAVAVQRAVLGEGFENQQVEGSLQIIFGQSFLAIAYP